MNEPSSFIDGSDTGCSDLSLIDNPPYIPSKKYFFIKSIEKFIQKYTYLKYCCF